MDESLQFIRKNLGITISIGSVFLLFFFTSYIGIIIGPITCVIAATIAIHYKFNLSKSKHAVKKQAEKKIEKATKQKAPQKPQKDIDEWG